MTLGKNAVVPCWSRRYWSGCFQIVLETMKTKVAALVQFLKAAS